MKKYFWYFDVATPIFVVLYLIMTTQAIAQSLSCSDINGARDLSITERRAAEIPYQLNQMIDEARVAAGLSGKKLQQLITGDQNTSANLESIRDHVVR